MEEVAKDADRRFKDRLVRQEKMETLKKQATLSFRRGDYEKALVLYDKVRGDLIVQVFPKNFKFF